MFKIVALIKYFRPVSTLINITQWFYSMWVCVLLCSVYQANQTFISNLSHLSDWTVNICGENQTVNVSSAGRFDFKKQALLVFKVVWK